MAMGVGIHAMRLNTQGKSGRTTMPLDKACVELGPERRSRSKNFDGSASRLNVYHMPEGVTTGKELSEWFEDRFREYNADRARRGLRRKPVTTNPAGTFILSPDEESMRGLTREQQLAVCDAMVAGWAEWAGHAPDAWVVHFDEGTRPGTCCHVHIADRMLDGQGDYGAVRSMSRGQITRMHRVIPKAVERALPGDVLAIVGEVKDHETKEQREERRAQGEFVLEGGLPANVYATTREALRERDRAREDSRQATREANDQRAQAEQAQAEARAAERDKVMAEAQRDQAQDLASYFRRQAQDLGMDGEGVYLDKGTPAEQFVPSLGQIARELTEQQDRLDETTELADESKQQLEEASRALEVATRKRKEEERRRDEAEERSTLAKETADKLELRSRQLSARVRDAEVRADRATTRANEAQEARTQEESRLEDLQRAYKETKERLDELQGQYDDTLEAVHELTDGAGVVWADGTQTPSIATLEEQARERQRTLDDLDEQVKRRRDDLEVATRRGPLRLADVVGRAVGVCADMLEAAGAGKWAGWLRDRVDGARRRVTDALAPETKQRGLADEPEVAEQETERQAGE